MGSVFQGPHCGAADPGVSLCLVRLERKQQERGGPAMKAHACDPSIQEEAPVSIKEGREAGCGEEERTRESKRVSGNMNAWLQQGTRRPGHIL